MAERPRARVAMMMVAIGVAACTSRDRADADAGASGRAEASAGAGAEAGAKGGALAIGAGSSRAVVDGIDAAVPVSAWVWKTYRGDRFSVLFPGEPKVTVLPLEEDKLSFDQAVVDVPGGQVSFLAGFTDHSQDAASKPDELLDEQAARNHRGAPQALGHASGRVSGARSDLASQHLGDAAPHLLAALSREAEALFAHRLDAGLRRSRRGRRQEVHGLVQGPLIALAQLP
jgi:hypothetical protein